MTREEQIGWKVFWIMLGLVLAFGFAGLVIMIIGGAAYICCKEQGL